MEDVRLQTRLYLVDTVALARYFEDSLPARADSAFREAEGGKAAILVPEIVIGEFIYTALKGRLRVSDPRAIIGDLLDEITSSVYLRQIGMTPDSWRSFLDSEIPELHGRMICTIATSSQASAIITGDPEIKRAGFPVIW